jgi:hypothetical protein
VSLHAPVRRRGASAPARRAPHPLPPPPPAWPHAARPHALASGIPIDIVVVLLAVLALALLNSVPPTLLSVLKIHYVTTGGAFYEKFHPGTYVFILAFCALLLRGRGPIAEIDRMISQAPLMIPYAFSILIVLIQSIVLGHPVTSTVDTFLLPIIACLVVWSQAPQDRRPLVWTLHVLMIVNVLLGYFEHLSGHRIVPLEVGNQVFTNEWRATALFGHPLRAAGLVGAYTLALLLRPSLCPSFALRAFLIPLCLGSLFMFGGRTALVMVLASVALVGAWSAFRLLRGARTRLPLMLAGICIAFVVAAAALALYDAGSLDQMLLRFTSDKGSAWARIESLNLLSSIPTRDLLLGSEAPHIESLQALFGIRVGIEDFWIACIAQYGLIATVILTIGLGCFFAEVLRRSHPAAIALMIFLVVIAASSVSFSAKGVVLTQYVLIMLLLLAKEPAPRPRHARVRALRSGAPRAIPR